MTVYRSPRGKWMIDVVLERPNGETLRVRKVAPVQTRRDAEAYERDLRRAHDLAIAARRGDVAGELVDRALTLIAANDD
ncbi:MAG: hypothetical protein IPH07_23785 [Deltaproteobacteria bacterium]|nr:hypothetical protein [Deltaproteobacteria bacterium]